LMISQRRSTDKRRPIVQLSRSGSTSEHFRSDDLVQRLGGRKGQAPGPPGGRLYAALFRRTPPPSVSITLFKSLTQA
jgi:hypothetical protein